MGKTVATNKKAFRDYSIQGSWECGIALKGAEVKSLRAGGVNFKDSFARIEKEEIWLYNLHIAPYAQRGFTELETDRPRKLLLHKKEIRKIETQSVQKRLALVPTKIYFNSRGFVKIELALGKGKRQYEKREAIKKRTIEKALKQTLRQRRR